MPADRPTPLTRSTLAWMVLLVGLLALRLPSLVQPAGGDQSLYAYSGTRVLAGDVPYRDMWDQKPPGVAFVYAALLSLWPHPSVVPGADLVAAACVAILLVVLGRRRFTTDVGFGAAATYLLLGDPYLQRLSGVYVRGQCEPFIALAVTAALVLLASPRRGVFHLVLAGACLAAGFWLKYNAIAYWLVAVAAIWLWRASPSLRAVCIDALWVGAGFIVVVAGGLAYFAAHDTLRDLWLATISYNLMYSGDTYAGRFAVPRYLLRMPFEHARMDLLWYVGCAGAAVLALIARSYRTGVVAIAWIVAAVCSITINGQRDLPNYFVQAAPALALAASAAAAAVVRSRSLWVYTAAVAVLLLGIWRVGTERTVAGLRWGGLPGLVENFRFDVAHIRGDIDRSAYLRRFKGPKLDAFEVDALATFIRTTTRPDEPVYVFGFLGGAACWLGERESASRFFWSMPIIWEFAADRSGYGSAGLLGDLTQRRPSVVALQKEQWESEAFFMANPPLRAWLETGYTLDHATPAFTVWRRKP